MAAPESLPVRSVSILVPLPSMTTNGHISPSHSLFRVFLHPRTLFPLAFPSFVPFRVTGHPTASTVVGRIVCTKGALPPTNGAVSPLDSNHPVRAPSAPRSQAQHSELKSSIVQQEDIYIKVVLQIRSDSRHPRRARLRFSRGHPRQLAPATHARPSRLYDNGCRVSAATGATITNRN